MNVKFCIKYWVKETQVKYEYRIFAACSSDDIINSGRWRLRMDLFVPITKKSYSIDKNLYGIIWSEIFLSNDEKIMDADFEFVIPVNGVLKVGKRRFLKILQ